MQLSGQSSRINSFPAPRRPVFFVEEPSSSSLSADVADDDDGDDTTGAATAAAVVGGQLKNKEEEEEEELPWLGFGVPALSSAPTTTTQQQQQQQGATRLGNAWRDSLNDLRQAARVGHVSSSDVVAVLGEMLERIARSNGNQSNGNSNGDMNGGGEAATTKATAKVQSAASLISELTPKTGSSSSISSAASFSESAAKVPMTTTTTTTNSRMGNGGGNGFHSSSVSNLNRLSGGKSQMPSSKSAMNFSTFASNGHPNSSSSSSSAAAATYAPQSGGAMTATGSSSSLNAVPAQFQTFFGKASPNVSLSWYLWRIVYYLNKYPEIEPSFFDADNKGMDKSSMDKDSTLSKTDDQSALSRGLRCLLLALLYIDRICTMYPDFPITPLSIHRLLLAAILVAAKFTDDLVVGEKNFARIGGVTVKELRKLELEFCSLIHFDLNVSDLEFERVCMRQLRLAFDVALNDVKSGKKRT